MGGDDTWYQVLVKTPGTPPPWVFGPVWSVLYVMMGVAGGRLIFRRVWPAVGLFGLQFVLNLAWTPVFFGAREPGMALLVILALWVSVLGTIFLARKWDRVSAWLLVPYLAWVSYATYLNAGIFWLNR
jgi:tryptophan-rich sensory protein